MTGLELPQLLAGRYELGPVIGAGGMATVHRGHDTVLGRTVAVKVFATDADAARVRDEGRALAALNHPGLVRVFDAGTARGSGPESAFLVMELVDGPTLAQCCLDGSLSRTEVARIGAELAEALAHAHGRGVVHRDVKPANILLDPLRQAKLTDFGIARLVDSARHTVAGTTVGTAPYLSPEQVTGDVTGPPADVYALGLVLLECLTGRREYPGSGVEAALARLHRPPAIPRSLPAPWPELLREMTDHDPARRPAASEVAAVLRAAAFPGARDGRRDAADSVTTSVLETVTPAGAAGVLRAAARDALRSRLVLSLAALLAVLAVLAGVALATTGSGVAPPRTRPAATRLDSDLHELHRAVTP